MTTLSTEAATAGSPDEVRGVLNYLADKDQHPVSYNFKPPPGVPARTGTYAKFTVAIHSARTIMSELSLDRQGFAVVRQNTAVAKPRRLSRTSVCSPRSSRSPIPHNRFVRRTSPDFAG